MPCLDVEGGIRADGAWVQPWLDASGAGLYGNAPVFSGRRAAFYETASDPHWNGTILEARRDLIGASGWKSRSELLTALEAAIGYVALGELSLLDACVDLCVEFVEGALERGIDGAQGWKSEGQSRAQDAIVGAREEQSHPQAELSDAIAEAVGDALDQAVKS